MLLVLALLAGLATDTRTVHEDVTWRPGTVVKVGHQYGNLTVQGWADDRVVLDAVIRATAADAATARRLSQSVRVLVAQQAETLVIRTVQPALAEPDEDCGYEVHLRLGIPDRAALVAANSFGDVELAGTRGGCSVSNRFGDVTVHDAGDCDITCKYGNVRVNNLAGELAVRNSFGDVFLDGVNARTVVDNHYGDVTADDLDGTVRLTNEMGQVTAHPGSGSLSVTNHYGDVAAFVADPNLANLDVESEFGQVKLHLLPFLPFRLGGRTTNGKVITEMPLRVSEQGPGRLVSGTQGSGGTSININGVWTDLLIEQQPAEKETTQ